ncbi:MAG: phosphoribosylanthranilate isomerase [Gammaproteobacteria bacterium]|nr:phosphoribosylanthranilate isomerase [Gammaproteobacteria bacterium]MBT3867116.1 phosphoribosylanthranilate isomerase [Gammaproteobacteria bacterium]MBT4380528.1 phosphoribosylanthranilate isomerase [Gammaproteobacteria bacterium]MBT4618503.1 phosphoribosylanthranilate isomerase [Gammaproteobacteria bacterium]MBT5198919.1 phosphoribosylanthranilate isomerase [Gammaproteobacteria bacterium]
MTRTRIKICGITNHEDAANAVACGADALGFNFFKGSTRYISPGKAAEICAQVPAFVATVGLFVNEPLADVNRIIGSLRLGLVQFHGDETPEYCDSVGHLYMKALRATNRDQIEVEAQSFQTAQAILVDTATDGQFGGTGKTFDWRMLPDLAKPVVLAGGLDATNVGAAIAATHPYAVDVSGGVERSRGVKDVAKMKKFVEAVQSADRSNNE